MTPQEAKQYLQHFDLGTGTFTEALTVLLESAYREGHQEARIMENRCDTPNTVDSDWEQSSTKRMFL